ncbi:hypothetical protein D3C73_1188180 [compost metagenome]
MKTEMAAKPSDNTIWLTAAPRPIERDTCMITLKPLGAGIRQPWAIRSTGVMVDSSTFQSRVLQRELSCCGSTSDPRRSDVNDTCSTTPRAAFSVCALSSRLVSTSAQRR